jgi:HAD superfamily hydrolase (TIGR01509 family)
MDGVLADSEPVYYQAVNIVLGPIGKQITTEQQRALMGHSIEDTWHYLARELDLGDSIEPYVAAYDRELRRLLAQVHEPLPGVIELVDVLKSRGVPVAIASSSLPSWVDALLGGLGMSDSFDALVSASMVENPKPAPDVYLLAAERLGVQPERCIALEDTPTGLASARAAAMLAVQVNAASTAFPPLPEADLVLASLKDFDLSLLDPRRD